MIPWLFRADRIRKVPWIPYVWFRVVKICGNTTIPIPPPMTLIISANGRFLSKYSLRRMFDETTIRLKPMPVIWKNKSRKNLSFSMHYHIEFCKFWRTKQDSGPRFNQTSTWENSCTEYDYRKWLWSRGYKETEETEERSTTGEQTTGEKFS